MKIPGVIKHLRSTGKFCLQVTNPEYLIRYPSVKHKHGLVSSILGIRFVLTSNHFLGGSMRVRCVASIPTFLRGRNRDSIVQAVPAVREALLLGK